MVRVTVNGRAVEVEGGDTILDALHAAGVSVPTLCHDPRLEPYGGCRLCLVRVAGWPKLVTACNAPLSDGLEIETHTAEIEDHRRTLLGLLAEDYPIAAALAFPDKELHRYLADYGLLAGANGPGPDDRGQPSSAVPAEPPFFKDETHPYMQVDMTRCITCFRCVRICDEVQGQFAWRVWNRGDRTRILPDQGQTLKDSACVSCGACVDACPSGALEDLSRLMHGAPTAWTRTTCPYCGVGCEMNVGTRDRRIVQITPVLDAPVNKGHLCIKGRYAFDFVHAEDRATQPMIRKAEGWQAVTWDEALAHTAAALQRLAERHGAGSLAVLGSARATNEENYLAQKFARLVLGTHNVDCCARVCHTPSAFAMKLMLGTGAATNAFDDIELAQTLMVAGANPTENHPVVGARIKQRVLGGAKLIVIDPRRTELAELAEIHLALRPGTNIPLLNALAAAIVEEGLEDASFIAERVDDWDAFRAFIAEFRPEQVAPLCGVEAGEIRRAARLYATAEPAMCLHGLGMTEHVQGTESVMGLVNLALLTGNIGRPGSGVNPLRGQNNVQGAAHMGCDPGVLTGSVSVADGRTRFEAEWGTPLPRERGLNLLEMMDAAAGGALKGLWVIGYDVALTNADAAATERALSNLELVIVQDLFLNETARRVGTVFLPAASSFEKDGTFMNGERRVQRVRPALAPIGDAKPDWQIICRLAEAMGHGAAFAFASPEAVWDEVRRVWPAGAGLSYARLDEAGLQWPCPSTDHPGTVRLHETSFAGHARAALRRLDYRPTAEVADPDYPYLLSTGRSLYQFNAGTMTMRTPNVRLRPTDLLELSPADAATLGIASGDRVRVVSRYGAVELNAKVSPSMKPGETFATFQDPASFVNRATGPHRDRYTLTPEYKVTAVRLEPVRAARP